MIGKVLGASSLGAYTLASNVILAPFSQIAGPLQQVLFPAFSMMQDDRERLASAWIRVTRLVGALSIPALVGLVVVAPDFVHVVLGQRWDHAIIVIRILAWVGLLQSLQTLNGEVLLALGRAGLLLAFTVVWFVFSVGGVAIGLAWGIVGVAIAYAVANTVVEPLNAYLTSRALRISPWRFVQALVGVSEAAALMGLVVLLIRAGLIAAGVGPAPRLALCIIAGVVVYAGCCLWRAPEVIDEIRDVRRTRGATARSIEDASVEGA